MIKLSPDDKELIDFNKHEEFNSEKELCDFIELNISQFCIEDLGFELDFYRRELPVSMNMRRGRMAHAVDFFIKTKCGKNIIVECKHPKSTTSELCRAIGQVLGYKAMFENNGLIIDSCIICSSFFSSIPYQIISRNKLPIDIIVMSKTKVIYGK